jgi:thiol-disulfide isomerase/thioredoxin
LVSLHPASPAGQLPPIQASTGASVLTESGGAGVAFAMTEADYQKLAAQVAKSPSFVAIAKRPAGASTSARYGINLSYAGKNRGWMLDGDDTAGYTLYPDLNANGDLTDDTPITMGMKDGKPSAYMSVPVTEAQGQYEVRFLLVVDHVAPPGKTNKELALRIYGSTHRPGEVVINGAPMKFSITGSQGVYDDGYTGIGIDLDHNGTIEPVVETYRNSERYINIDGRTYEFKTDRYGRSVTFTPLAEKRPDRAILVAGYPAPDFSFTGHDGSARTLSDYRGKVVLIDFWGTWCGPCVAAAPEIASLYERYHPQGFEIVGVDTGDTKEQLMAFIAGRRMPWPEAMESDKGPINTLFRINGWPSYFLVGADGKLIVAAANGAPFDLAKELVKLFPQK